MTPLLRPEEAAEKLNVSIHTLRLWRELGKGPKVVRMSRAIRYTEEALEEFVEARTQL